MEADLARPVTDERTDAWARRLRDAEATGIPIVPLRTEMPAADEVSAYSVQQANVAFWCAQGRRIEQFAADIHNDLERGRKLALALKLKVD